MPWGTEAEYAALLARGVVREVITAKGDTATAGHTQEGKKQLSPNIASALLPSTVEIPRDRFRSDTERRYAQVLELRKYAGEIVDWYYEPIRLFLAPRTTLTVDFLVVMRGKNLALHEVKAAWYKEDGWVKLKMAARLYPCFTFVLCQWKERGWYYQTIPAV